MALKCEMSQDLFNYFAYLEINVVILGGSSNPEQDPSWECLCPAVEVVWYKTIRQ